MLEEYNTLRETILSHGFGKDIVYLPNRGNWGDALIREGTLRFFSDSQITFTELKKVNAKTVGQLGEGKLILIGGGGAWCSIWDHSAGIVESLVSRHTVIVLPSTFELKPRFKNTIYFSRDRFESMENVPGSFFCHDMAFYLKRKYQFKKHGKGKGSGFFFRTDPESKFSMKPMKSNQDISTKGNERTNTQRFFRKVGKYEVIFTDRLHVSIAGCLLGKEVHFYPGSYFKNRAVYRSSMELQFKKIYFHESLGEEISSFL
jgi:exopolysaccharide biosynthesis predicted pyruvyltransferase EpsI